MQWTDLGACAALCDSGLLTARLWASTAKSVHEMGAAEAGQLRGECAYEALVFGPLPPNVWSLEMQPQYCLGAC